MRQITPLFSAGAVNGFGAEDSRRLLMQVVFNLLFVMDARPELVVKIERHKKRELREIWTPNILGGRYRLQAGKDGANGTGASVRMHWRRGHYRLQHHGANNAAVKIIWIEPVMVNKPEMEKQNG